MNIMGLLNINKGGLNANQNDLDTVANNIANVNTVGFKAKTASFQALINNQVTADEVPLAGGPQISLNAGVQAPAGPTDYSQGIMQNTGNSTDFAIQGNGFFGVQGPNNQLLLTRAGNFERDARGDLVTANGQPVATTDIVPRGQWPAGQMTVAPTGAITIQTANGQVNVGRINIYQPSSTSDLQAVGDNNYQVTGGNIQLISGQPGAGSITQGMLEGSNVDLSNQMAEMITSQRAYQLNAKALQTTDDILSTTNNFNQ